jgi:protein SCO1/2
MQWTSTIYLFRAKFSLEELKGDVVIVTGIYTLCSNTCPLILVELSELLEELSPEDRKRTHVVAVTLNPENETPATMSNFVAAYGFEYPQFRYLNGDPTYVKELLKKLQLSRTVVPETGLIDHANLFIFIDTEGEIAYRLTLDDRHNTWLRAALKELTSETKSTNESLALNQDTL